jgi:hypothetical protein
MADTVDWHTLSGPTTRPLLLLFFFWPNTIPFIFFIATRPLFGSETRTRKTLSLFFSYYIIYIISFFFLFVQILKPPLLQSSKTPSTQKPTHWSSLWSSNFKSTNACAVSISDWIRCFESLRMEEAVKRNGLQVRRLSLIDVSSEDDSLITSDSLDHPSSGAFWNQKWKWFLNLFSKPAVFSFSFLLLLPFFFFFFFFFWELVITMFLWYQVDWSCWLCGSDSYNCVRIRVSFCCSLDGLGPLSRLFVVTGNLAIGYL